MDKQKSSSRWGSASSSANERRQELLRGFVIGILSWLAATQLGAGALPGLKWLEDSPWGIPLMGMVGAILSLTGARRVLWVGSAGLCCLAIVVGSTPVAMPLARGLVRNDRLQPADAVYVLGSGLLSDGKLPDNFQMRVFHAYEILEQGYAPRLLIPRLFGPAPSAVPEIRRQMKLLRLTQTLEEIGPVASTFEEATLIEKIMRQHHWQRIILVSSPTHMRRVRAVFEKAGVPLLCSPCTEGSFDLNSSGSPDGRFAAFRSWIHEVIGYKVYQLRGRI
ncbi:MAG: YdcF family protein [Abitibacteriaceae bacterium]|nr:YdcF family protein [Abditibacteriaceae bacterium]